MLDFGGKKPVLNRQDSARAVASRDPFSPGEVYLSVISIKLFLGRTIMSGKLTIMLALVLVLGLVGVSTAQNVDPALVGWWTWIMVQARD